MKVNADPKTIDEVLAEMQRCISTFCKDASTAETPEVERLYIGKAMAMENARYLVERLKENTLGEIK